MPKKYKLLDREVVNFEPSTYREHLVLALYHLQDYTEGCRCWGIDDDILPNAYAALVKLSNEAAILRKDLDATRRAMSMMEETLSSLRTPPK